MKGGLSRTSRPRTCGCCSNACRAIRRARWRRDVPVAWPDPLTREYTVRFVREETFMKTPEVAE